MEVGGETVFCSTHVLIYKILYINIFRKGFSMKIIEMAHKSGGNF